MTRESATNVTTTPRVLLADVGGTNVRFAQADPARARPLLDDSVRQYRVVDFTTFTDAALAYLGETKAHVERGVFGFAGPIEGDAVRLTNHPWMISLPRVRAELALTSVHFINDFVAMSLSIPLLASAGLHTIGAVEAHRVDTTATQTFAVLGPGTGLGAGALLLRDGHAIALESEGGHSGFAPRTGEEVEVLRRLSARFGRVSNERVLSGAGLVNLHQALAAIHGTRDEGLVAEEITQRATDGTDPVCERTLEMFCELLGAFAGDCALAYGAWDGVFLAGGLVPPMLPWLERGGFRRRFEDKGRLEAKLARVPTVAILNPQAGLLGAAVFAVNASGRALARIAAAGGRPARS